MSRSDSRALWPFSSFVTVTFRQLLSSFKSLSILPTLTTSLPLNPQTCGWSSDRCSSNAAGLRSKTPTWPTWNDGLNGKASHRRALLLDSWQSQRCQSTLLIIEHAWSSCIWDHSHLRDSMPDKQIRCVFMRPRSASTETSSTIPSSKIVPRFGRGTQMGKKRFHAGIKAITV